MPNDGSAEYYESRRQASLAMSQNAAHPSIEKIHLELARRYAKLADEPDPAPLNTHISIRNGGNHP